MPRLCWCSRRQNRPGTTGLCRISRLAEGQRVRTGLCSRSPGCRGCKDSPRPRPPAPAPAPVPAARADTSPIQTPQRRLAQASLPTPPRTPARAAITRPAGASATHAAVGSHLRPIEFVDSDEGGGRHQPEKRTFLGVVDISDSEEEGESLARDLLVRRLGDRAHEEKEQQSQANPALAPSRRSIGVVHGERGVASTKDCPSLWGATPKIGRVRIAGAAAQEVGPRVDPLCRTGDWVHSSHQEYIISCRLTARRELERGGGVGRRGGMALRGGVWAAGSLVEVGVKGGELGRKDEALYLFPPKSLSPSYYHHASLPSPHTSSTPADSDSQVESLPWIPDFMSDPLNPDFKSDFSWTFSAMAVDLLRNRRTDIPLGPFDSPVAATVRIDHLPLPYLVTDEMQ
ncbi:hypothetical protein B0H17DRAFT_1129826 [Mycena rosella]|uniref:Uncharacterized protein n=1 Tax=Mycena rosella TaxID=1033263 RepID=A0AAD7GP37_MYCRO|nr:hypothetical protein B0H17DRAFT_1129826 [Mycena rosella]